MMASCISTHCDLSRAARRRQRIRRVAIRNAHCATHAIKAAVTFLPQSQNDREGICETIHNLDFCPVYRFPSYVAHHSLEMPGITSGDSLAKPRVLLPTLSADKLPDIPSLPARSVTVVPDDACPI